MKKSVNKVLSVVLAAVICSSTMPAYAASIGSSADDITVGIDSAQNARTTYSTERTDTNVYLTVDGDGAMVGIPTSIILDGESILDGMNTGRYEVYVKGDIAGEQSVIVEPEESVTLSQTGKPSVDASVEQNKTEFAATEIADGSTTEGIVTAENLSAGSWNGGFVFNISMQDTRNQWFDVTKIVDIMNNGNVGTWNMYGAFTEESGKHYINIPVVAGEKYKITGRCWGSDRLAIIKNCLGKQKNDYILAEAPAMGVNGPGNTTTIYELTVPEGGTWLCLSVADFVANYFKIEKLGNANVDVSKQYTDETMQWQFDKKYMTITIDDTNDNLDQIVEIAERYNVPLNFATQPSRLGGKCLNGEVKKDVLLRVQSEGSEILVHDHAFMTKDSPYSDYKHFYVENKKLLEDAGFEINGVIVAGGTNYGNQDFALSTKLAYEAGYLYSDLTAENNVFNKRFYNPRTWGDNYTLEQWKTSIDNFAKKDTGWYNLGTHCYAPYDSTSKMTAEMLENIVKYALENDIEIVTWNTLYDNCAVNK